LPATALSPLDLEALYAEAASVTAVGSKSFYFATRLFPPQLARYAHSVYWFCRHTDDLVDEAASREIGQAELNSWEAQTRLALAGRSIPNPLLRLFAHTCEQCGIPEEYPLELIAGVRMDLHQQRYASFDELRVFCYRVASCVGLMMCHVIGFTDPSLEESGKQQAIDLGIAMQLTNILRDVGTDLKLGRIYFPQEDLDRFQVSEADLHSALQSGIATKPFIALMRFEMERARTYYERAHGGIEKLKPEGRFAVEIAARVYARILRRIEGNGFDVFHRRAVVPAYEKYWITATSILRAKLGASA
jgi:15-cis-phytoene synthase